MLELFYKERRSVTDFRRGILGSFFDPFAQFLHDQGYSRNYAKRILGLGCQFNSFLIEKGITRGKDISWDLMEAFLDAYLLHASSPKSYCPRANARRELCIFMSFLLERKVFLPPKSKPIRKPYSWILDPYLQYLQQDCELSPPTLGRARAWVGDFLEALGKCVTRPALKKLNADKVDQYIQQHLKDEPERQSSMGSALRRFFRYGHIHGFFAIDFSALIPPIRRYRHCSLPKGLEDSAIKKALGLIKRNTPIGTRDYAIMLLMMAYGIRGVSAAQLLLEDIDWSNSKIRIRAQKGGKEVCLPLMDSVGEAIISYLRSRYEKSQYREVFLTVKAPFRPLGSVVISRIIRRYLIQAGVHIPGGGARTLRHSWAIRALAHDSPIKAIADVLGHRYIDTTFIYAKADLKTLRDVVMPWPEGK